MICRRSAVSKRNQFSLCDQLNNKSDPLYGLPRRALHKRTELLCRTAGDTAFVVNLTVILTQQEHKIVPRLRHGGDGAVRKVRACRSGFRVVAIRAEACHGSLGAGQHSFLRYGTVEPVLQEQGQSYSGSGQKRNKGSAVKFKAAGQR